MEREEIREALALAFEVPVEELTDDRFISDIKVDCLVELNLQALLYEQGIDINIDDVFLRYPTICSLIEYIASCY